MNISPSDLRALHRAKTIYVIVVKDKQGRFGLVKDPGLGRPWSSPNKRLAEHIAAGRGKELGMETSAMLIEDALSLPGFKEQLSIEIALAQAKKGMS